MSMSSADEDPDRYFSKYFMFESKRFFSHLKSLFDFLLSSQTWITITSLEPSFAAGLTWPVEAPAF